MKFTNERMKIVQTMGCFSHYLFSFFLSHANEQIVREGVDGRGGETEIIYFEISRFCEHLRCPNEFTRQFILLYVKINTKKNIFSAVCACLNWYSEI